MNRGYISAATLLIAMSASAQQSANPTPVKSAKDNASFALGDAGDYTLGPDSMVQPGVPQGKISKHRLEDCSVYPGNSHDYWVYVPQQYDPKKPASLMVFTDGEGYINGYKVPIVFDNLINKGELPVIIGVFVNPGPRGPGYPIWGGSDNRSIEYDSVTDGYARFLLSDVLPKVEDVFNVSRDPNRRAIAGTSSGGNAAITVAWQRPDAFRKVLSFVGSFTAMRGGNEYPSLIRKTERKPLRVFLQDGSKDLDIIFGNWPIANQDMASALAYREYDYKFVFGEGGHSGKHGAAILPDAMRWLWRD